MFYEKYAFLNAVCPIICICLLHWLENFCINQIVPAGDQMHYWTLSHCQTSQIQVTWLTTPLGVLKSPTRFFFPHKVKLFLQTTFIFFVKLWQTFSPNQFHSLLISLNPGASDPLGKSTAVCHQHQLSSSAKFFFPIFLIIFVTIIITAIIIILHSSSSSIITSVSPAASTASELHMT